MKYTTEILIDLPRDEFIKKLEDPENMKHWQKGLVSYEQLSKNPGQEGAQMGLKYKMGNREMDLIETIIKKNLPEEMHATYDAKGVHNLQKNYYRDEDGKTRWVTESDFQFSGFGMKLMGFLMPGAFKKQTLIYMQDFKKFAEEGISATDSQ
ncbi:SRPBCC family protein [Flagellimonas aequoris]|uniref:SRPBCC family protein n=1 Tax=Flagellimonas aequoris TaxID=2306997 RepID=A0A418N2N9_9FLAO|nr:SRPBCC family protein [Allomuricauda aequoris]RIV67600.1 SRPBCC family protein [Allomuricauda aequoris]TXJ99425.1 SRPBCC family protein [Allomuricauda aequoris]